MVVLGIFAVIATALAGAERIVASFPDAHDIASWGTAATLIGRLS